MILQGLATHHRSWAHQQLLPHGVGVGDAQATFTKRSNPLAVVGFIGAADGAVAVLGAGVVHRCQLLGQPVAAAVKIGKS
jgi:hypothetical protein